MGQAELLIVGLLVAVAGLSAPARRLSVPYPIVLVVVGALFRFVPGLPEVPDIRLHDLRHTCATLMLLESVHPKLVQELLGHATISITLDTYSHVLPSMGDEAARAMERIFS